MDKDMVKKKGEVKEEFWKGKKTQQNKPGR